MGQVGRSPRGAEEEMKRRVPSHTSGVVGALLGAGLGILLFLMYRVGNRFAQHSAVAELFYVLGSFGTVIPGILAGLLAPKFPGVFAAAYGALVGWLYTVFQRQRKLLILAIGLVHLAALVLIDLAWRFMPFPFFWSR